MKRIAIIGPSGSGKSTLARHLGRILHIKVYHLDRLFWLPSWQIKDRDTRISILQHLVLEKEWIIEGSYISSSDTRLLAADTIIFLDTPSLLCLLRVIKRKRENKQRPRRDLPIGSGQMLSLRSILKIALFPLRDRKLLLAKLNKLADLSSYLYRQIHEPPIIRIISTKEVIDFIEHIEDKHLDILSSPRFIEH